jgi:hypothetical protein
LNCDAQFLGSTPSTGCYELQFVATCPIDDFNLMSGSPVFAKLLHEGSNCLGVPLVVTGGAEKSGHTQHSKHYTGQAVDFGFNSNPGIGSESNQFFCCAINCGIRWGWVEGPKQHRPPHYHVQTDPGNGVPKIPAEVCPTCRHKG